MGWLSDISNRFGDNLKRSKSFNSRRQAHLGILAFETAKTLSRLVAIYKSLSDQEITRLRKDVLESEGVKYLNSSDESFLFGLACAERLEDLDITATAVARLGGKCSNFGLNRFDVFYADLKYGTANFDKLEYGSRKIEKKIKKLERLIYATASLYSSLEALTELEVSERKLKQWRKNGSAMPNQKMNFDLFDEKIANQRKQVRYLREISLWSKTFDKIVGLMARITCIVYARICTVFGSYIPVLPACLRDPIEGLVCSQSGPIPSRPKASLIRFYSQKSIVLLNVDNGAKGSFRNNKVFHAAGPCTVGGSGLALRYANVILLAERYLESGMRIGQDAREDLYEMLPENLKTSVRSKLSKNVKCPDTDESLAEGWRAALQSMMGWLAPVAHDTLQWQMERNYEKMKFELKPPVLLLQTLHFSDKEKTEAAIAEVLVGLSCIYWCENRQQKEAGW